MLYSVKSFHTLLNCLKCIIYADCYKSKWVYEVYTYMQIKRFLSMIS